MGTEVAPNYAYLFMDRIETKSLDQWAKKILLQLRFIDVIFMIWTHGSDELTKLITYLNEIHPKIKFTHESSESAIKMF